MKCIFVLCPIRLVHKGMLRSAVLGQFYLDLQDELYKSAFAIYHRRYSTNPSPKWPLSQPMRFLGHNGEINTKQGNLNWMQSRERTIKSPVWRGRESEIQPYGNPKASDSANLDSAAEVVDFYDYYKGQMEAWDGPALLLFSDGKTVGGCLHRNGLRPTRFWRTADDFVYVASEAKVSVKLVAEAGIGTVASGAAKGNADIGQVRGTLAQLGYEKMDDIIGRTELLRPRTIPLMKAQHIDLSYVLSCVGLPKWSSTEIRTRVSTLKVPSLMISSFLILR